MFRLALVVLGFNLQRCHFDGFGSPGARFWIHFAILFGVMIFAVSGIQILRHVGLHRSPPFQGNSFVNRWEAGFTTVRNSYSRNSPQ
jgi:hypothetical protein